MFSDTFDRCRIISIPDFSTLTCIFDDYDVIMNMIIFVSQPFDNAVAHKDSTKRPPAGKGFSLFTVFAWYLLILFTLKYFSIFARRSKKYTFSVILFSNYFYERK